MSAEPVWQRALDRYADTVYRLALLRDARSKHALAATVRAFTGVDWAHVEVDERLEGRIVAQLPPVPRSLRPASLPALPAAFRALEPDLRLALGLRLVRGYDSASIAAVLGRPVEDIGRALVAALATLAGDDAPLPAACVQSRRLRLDEPAADKLHLRGCERCRVAVVAVAETEKQLASAMIDATRAVTLPWNSVEQIALRLRGAKREPDVAWRRPAFLTGAVVVLVALLVGVIVSPRRADPASNAATVVPRELVQRALEQLRAPPTGDGVLHRRYVLDLWQSEPARTAEVWLDPSRPGRHLLQIARGTSVTEWQSGDGQRSLRYWTDDASVCAGPFPPASLGLDTIHSWQLDAAEQTQAEAERWQHGPLAAGQRFLEQGLKASTLRSLGVTRAGDVSIATLSAEGTGIEGTLLLKIDAHTAALLEVRQLVADNGSTRAHTPWRLELDERVSSGDAAQRGLFSEPHIAGKPAELRHAGPMLDRACPPLREDFAGSLIEAVGREWPEVPGFPIPPAGTRRVMLIRSQGGERRVGEPDAPDTPALVYDSGARRLVLAPSYDVGRSSAGEVATGSWRVVAQPLLPGMWQGRASLVAESRPGLQIAFVAEGWSREEVRALIRGVRPLQLADVQAQRTLLYDPNPPPQEVIDLVTSAAQQLRPAPGRVQHSVVTSEQRGDPRRVELRDPYHAPPPAGETETWLQVGQDGTVSRFKSESRTSAGEPAAVRWLTDDFVATYEPRTNTLGRVPRHLLLTPAFLPFDDPLAGVFRRRQYHVERDGGRVILRATLPISQTELRWALDEQRRDPVRGAFPSPWLLDLNPRTVTFSTTFDAQSRRWLATEAQVSDGERVTVVQSTKARMVETLQTVPDSTWSVVPPADALVVDANERQYAMFNPQWVTKLEQALAAAPVPLWGWTTPGAVFRGATIPADDRGLALPYGRVESAIAGGYAVQLEYRLPEGVEARLLEGSPTAMRRLLRSRPSEWMSSRQQSATVAGATRVVWLLDGPVAQRGAIFEIDGTMIVAAVGGEISDDAVLALIGRLEPLK